jgi:hypothetical protein
LFPAYFPADFSAATKITEMTSLERVLGGGQPLHPESVN